MPWAGYPRPIAPRLAALGREVGAPTRTRTRRRRSRRRASRRPAHGALPVGAGATGVFFTKYLDGERSSSARALGARASRASAAHAHAYFGPGQSGFETGFDDWQLVPGITFDYQTDPYVTSDKLDAARDRDARRGRERREPPVLRVVPLHGPARRVQVARGVPALRKAPARSLRRGGLLHRSLDRQAPRLRRRAAVGEADRRSSSPPITARPSASTASRATRTRSGRSSCTCRSSFYVPGSPAARDRHAARARDLAPTIVELLGAKNVPALPRHEPRRRSSPERSPRSVT